MTKKNAFVFAKALRIIALLLSLYLLIWEASNLTDLILQKWAEEETTTIVYEI